MFKIDSPGATVLNLFTEGNPQSGIPATEVSDEWLNAVQTEIVNVIEGAGLTLNKPDSTQLLQALAGLISIGGTPTQLKEDIANAQASAASIAGLIYDKVDFKAVKIDFELHRQTDSSDVQEMGTIFLNHDTVADVWRISVSSAFDDAGVVFSVTSSGQVQYTSDNIAGANYTGKIRVAAVTKFQQGA